MPSHLHNGLNPCFNGRWSRTRMKTLNTNQSCLNPCFNGRWSRTAVLRFAGLKPIVLILVLMEDGLGLLRVQHRSQQSWVLILVLMEDGLGRRPTANGRPIVKVLILVLMEDGLGPVNPGRLSWGLESLNPCFNGRWSRTH